MLKRKVASLFAFILLLCSCSHLTPAQQTLWAINVYRAQYDLYLDHVINPALPVEEQAELRKNPALIKGNKLNPNLSEEQKEVLRVKKDVLKELKPLVLMASDYSLTGKVPPKELQDQLTSLINRLLLEMED